MKAVSALHHMSLKSQRETLRYIIHNGRAYTPNDFTHFLLVSNLFITSTLLVTTAKLVRRSNTFSCTAHQELRCKDHAMLQLLVAGTPTSTCFVETSSQVVQKHCHISSFLGMMMPAVMFSRVARSDSHLLFFSSIMLPGVLLYPSGSASILLPCVLLSPSWSAVVLHFAS